LWFLLADLRNLLAFFKKAKTPSKTPMEDYTIIVPIWGNYKILKFLERYADKTLFLTITNQCSPSLKAQLNRFESLGAKVFEVDCAIRAKDDAKFFALKLCLDRSLIRTKYVVMIDADSFFRADIGKACHVLEEQKLDLATLKLVPSVHSNLLEKLQHIEYAIGMRTRHYFPWWTSACFIARTEALKKIMQHHTLYPYGGDVEVGLIAKLLGMKITHIRFNIYTRVPKSIKSLFNQRKRWWTGCFRRIIINAKITARHETLSFLYTFIFVYLLYPLRWGLPLFFPRFFPILFLILWLIHIPITILSSGSKPSWIMALFPLYAFFKVTFLFLPIFGTIEWFRNYLKNGETGRFKV